MTTAAYEHNGQHTSREAFYAIACDPRRSVAVEACAGAGKTWMLVSRIVRALLDGCPAHEILAITFTKKAAGEMRSRLHEWLAEFAQTPLEDLAQELRNRGISDEMLLQRRPDLREVLQKLQHTLLTTGRPVQIRTFHSWFAALLRTAPLAVLQGMGLPTQYELLEDDTEAVALVWLPFYAAVLADAALAQDFHAVVAAHGRAQTHKALAGALSRRVEFVLADEAGTVDASVQAWDAQFPALSGHATPADWLWSAAPRAQLLHAARALGQASAKTFAAKGGELEIAVTAADAAGVCDALLTQKGEPRKFGEKIVGIDQVRSAQDLVLQFNAAQTQHEAWDYQQRMARLARRLVAEFAALKRSRGWVDMNDVERAAQTMLSDSVLSGWMQERLDARVRHLLIDEFQDTNPLQWQALHAWLSAYVGSGGGATRPSVFIVGDPKQSIYRFRRAEPQVFRAAQAFVVDGLGGDRLSCDHTRRNAPEVIHTVNQTMAAAQDAGEYSDFRQHTTESTTSGAVLCLPQIARDGLPSEDEDAVPEHSGLHWRDSLATPREVAEETLRTLECRQAAHWLVAHMAQHRLQPQDVMVLSRRRDRLAVMRDALRALNVPTEQPEKNDLCEAPEVQDLVALLDVLVSPAHDLSLARALRSPLWGLGDDDLVQIALAQRRARAEVEAAANTDSAGFTDTSWWGLLQNDELLPQHIRALAPVLVLYKGWVDTLPPHDALDAIYRHGDVLARFAAAAPATLRASTLDNLRALLGAALNHAGGRYATPYGFVRALKAGGIPAGAPATSGVAGGAVRLLTVHGAKGLEASLVLLLDTDGAPPKTETMGVLVDWPGASPAPERFLFLVRETNPPACAVQALQTEQAARLREELNGLYVAMTRARQQLVLSSVAPHRVNPNSWWQRVQGLCAPVEVVAETVESMQGAPAAETSPILMKILPPAPVLPAQAAIKTVANEPRTQATPASAESLIGQAMHRLLEWAPLGVSATAHTAARQAAAAREFALTDAQAAQAAALAQRILQGAGAWIWQADQVDWHGNEVALAVGGALLRLDRLVRHRGTGEWWVLDYKSAAQPQQQPALRAQLHSYRQAVQAQQPGAVVRAAFLTGQGALEEVMGLEDAPVPS